MPDRHEANAIGFVLVGLIYVTVAFIAAVVLAVVLAVLVAAFALKHLASLCGWGDPPPWAETTEHLLEIIHAP